MSRDLCTETGWHINRIVHIFRRGGVIFCPIPIGFLRVFIIIILFTVPSTALFFGQKNNSALLEWFKTLGSIKIQNNKIYYAYNIEIHIRHPVDCPHAQQRLMTIVFFVYCPVLSIYIYILYTHTRLYTILYTIMYRCIRLRIAIVLLRLFHLCVSRVCVKFKNYVLHKTDRV